MEIPGNRQGNDHGIPFDGFHLLLLLLPRGCSSAVYFLINSLACPSVRIERRSSSISFFTTAARCSTWFHRSSETGRFLLNAFAGNLGIRTTLGAFAIFPPT